MTTKEARQIIMDMGLSAEVILQADKILSQYKDDEEIPDDVINKILMIVDVEIDANQLVADVYESGTELADDFLKKVDDESKKIKDDIDSVVK
ncbi:MAG: hypothetical protein NTY75_00325 [Candidatus Shapirobacteria bacterium]|nr:hypothetical protein [Candidatus Shapirobacteria bacterium]